MGQYWLYKSRVFIKGTFGSPSVLVLYVSQKVQNGTNLRVYTNLTLRGLYSDEYGHDNEKEDGDRNGHINEYKQGKRSFFPGAFKASFSGVNILIG